MCKEFKLTKWSEELIKNKLKHQCKITDKQQLSEIINTIKYVVEDRNLYHSEKDFPKNSEELGELWLVGDLNGLKVGDRVQLKYILNIDGVEDEDIKMLRSCQDEFATVTGFKNRIHSELSKHMTVDFDNEELTELSDYLFLPMQFIKVTRGLRAKLIFMKIIQGMVKKY